MCEVSCEKLRRRGWGEGERERSEQSMDRIKRSRNPEKSLESRTSASAASASVGKVGLPSLMEHTVAWSDTRTLHTVEASLQRASHWPSGK